MSEIIIVLVLFAVLFGAGRLPELMGAVGRGVKEFQDGVDHE
jgi:sec-independent protein translocase protein TatA